MLSAPLPPNEAQRLEALAGYGLLDTPFEAAFDAVVDLAAALTGAPVALISLVDRSRQWFKAVHGMEGMRETPRELAFCAHAILDEQAFEVIDAAADSRFADNPLVTAAPFLRAYYGIPLRTPDGFALGTLCVIDHQPRRLDEARRRALDQLATVACAMLEGRRAERERAQGASALAQSELRLRLAVEAAGLGVWDWRVSDTHAYFSPRWSEMLGFAPGEFGNHVTAWDCRVAPEDYSLAHNAMADHFAGVTDQYRTELRMQARDGSTVWVLDQARVVERDEAGHPLRVIGTRENISPRKRLEQALMQANDNLEARVRERTSELKLLQEQREQAMALLDLVFNEAPSALGVVDGELRYRRINRGLAQFHHLSPVDCLNMRIGELTPALDSDLVPACRRVLATGAAQTGIELGSANGGVKHWLASLYRVPLEAQAWGLSLVLTDVTERRLREADRERLLAREQTLQHDLETSVHEMELLSATLSHVLRGPARALQAGAELLAAKAETMDAECRHTLARLQVNADRITVMAESLLDYLKQTQLPVQPAHLDLADVMMSVWEDLGAGQAGAARLVVGSLPPCRADAHLARIVCENLLSNALKYSGGAPQPHIEVGGDHHNAANVYFVRDNGVGFDPSHAQRLFKPFGRLHSAEEFAGTGLGLASVRCIVERHGGKGWADARPGEGATFYFTLPAQPRSETSGQ